MRPLAQLEQLSRVAMAQGHSWEEGVGDSISDPRMKDVQAVVEVVPSSGSAQVGIMFL